MWHWQRKRQKHQRLQQLPPSPPSTPGKLSDVQILRISGETPAAVKVVLSASWSKGYIDNTFVVDATSYALNYFFLCSVASVTAHSSSAHVVV